jgi:F-type H+-transporting ATPase subunit a
VKNKHIIAFLALLVSFFASPTLFAGGAGEGDMKQQSISATMHHIGDAHEFHLFGHVSIPLPCIAFSDKGFFFSLSSAFEHGNKAVDGFMMHHGTLLRIKGFEKAGVVDISEMPATFGGHGNGNQTVDTAGVHGGHTPAHTGAKEAHPQVAKNKDGKMELSFEGKTFELEGAAALQNFGSSWYDFSITKNVFSMFLAFLLMYFLMRKIANAYEINRNKSPKGLQSLLEPVIVFLRDEVAKPAIGKTWEKYFPFVLSLFFFILINNLIGLVPFFPGGSNVTGNLGTTIVLAFFTFLVVNFSGNKHYWQHIFWMPGVPAFVKVILTPIEVLGIFLKPITLFIRLFANITAGHIIILSLVSLIFIFNESGQLGGAPGGIAIAVPFVFALNFMELLVAFLQAFIFSLLTCLYIGSAVEEHEHHDEHAEAHH